MSENTGVAGGMAALQDFQQRMSPHAADKFLHVKNNTIQGAIQRGEIRPYRYPDSSRVFVTPRILSEWLERYCRPEVDVLPG